MHLDHSSLTGLDALAARHNNAKLKEDIEWAKRIDPSKYKPEVLKKLRYHYLIGLANQ